MASLLVPSPSHHHSIADRQAQSIIAAHLTVRREIENVRAVGGAIGPADARDAIARGGSMWCGCGELVFGWVLGVWLLYWRAESECAVLQP